MRSAYPSAYPGKQRFCVSWCGAHAPSAYLCNKRGWAPSLLSGGAQILGPRPLPCIRGRRLPGAYPRAHILGLAGPQGPSLLSGGRFCDIYFWVLSSLAAPGALLAAPGALLAGLSWASLGRSWGSLGRSWVSLGPLLAAPGALLGLSWPLLGLSWRSVPSGCALCAIAVAVSEQASASGGAWRLAVLLSLRSP